MIRLVEDVLKVVGLARRNHYLRLTLVRRLGTKKIYSAATIIQLTRSAIDDNHRATAPADGQALNGTIVVEVNKANKRSIPKKNCSLATPKLSSTVDPLSPATYSSSKILARYEEIQRQYPRYFIMMQVGDFFEVYGDAAEHAAKILDIALGYTKGKTCVPMTGIPVRSLETYVERFLKAGHPVVICEQQLTPHGLTRVVSRVVTPGTLTEENLLDGGANNFLLALVSHGEGKGSEIGLAWIDISTGYFRTAVSNLDSLSDHFVRINPREVLVDKQLNNLESIRLLRRVSKAVYTEIDTGDMVVERAMSTIVTLLSGNDEDAKVASLQLDRFSNGEIYACSAILDYIVLTQLQQKPFIEFPVRFEQDKVMMLDASALKSLEVVQQNSTAFLEQDDEEGATIKSSLLSVLDQTKTAMGARLLSNRLRAPSTCIKTINQRLEMVNFFYQNFERIESLRRKLYACKDLERCYQRLALKRSSGGPRDMQLIMETLQMANELNKELVDYYDPNSIVISSLTNDLGTHEQLVNLLSTALNDNLPSRAYDGNIIRSGFDMELDRLKDGGKGLKHACKALEAVYQQETKKSSLKIIEGKQLGFIIEVSRADGPIPDSPKFILDGQLDGKYRYRTLELNQLRDNHDLNESKCLQRELVVFEDLRTKILEHGRAIIKCAKSLAELDVTIAMARVARNRNYIRPMVTESHEFEIYGGRHPVVEAMHRDIQGHEFVSNNCNLNPTNRFAFITGPNMGGKSTFLRQNALFAIMAQTGSFVPADHAKIGIVDSVYTRIGAADDLARDRSTFMMEMLETAYILKSATAKSLLLLDEIGRGTSTDEGYALAWAICQYLNEKVASRTLFATHYIELAELITQYPHTQCLKTSAIEDSNGQVTFLHKLCPGVADHSHAISIAQFAGIPDSILVAARNKLALLRRQPKPRPVINCDPPNPQDTINTL